MMDYMVSVLFWAEHDHGTGTVDGLQIGSDTTEAGKAWGVFQACGRAPTCACSQHASTEQGLA